MGIDYQAKLYVGWNVTEHIDALLGLDESGRRDSEAIENGLVNLFPGFSVVHAGNSYAAEYDYYISAVKTNKHDWIDTSAGAKAVLASGPKLEEARAIAKARGVDLGPPKVGAALYVF